MPEQEAKVPEQEVKVPEQEAKVPEQEAKVSEPETAVPSLLGLAYLDSPTTSMASPTPSLPASPPPSLPQVDGLQEEPSEDEEEEEHHLPGDLSEEPSDSEVEAAVVSDEDVDMVGSEASEHEAEAGASGQEAGPVEVSGDGYKSDFDEDVEEDSKDVRRAEESDSNGDSDTEGMSEGSKQDAEGVAAALALFEDEVKAGESDSEIEEVVAEVKQAEEEMSQDEGDLDDEEDEDKVEDEEESDEDDSVHPQPVRQPCILVFDSLGGKKDRQARLCQTLRDFLTMEWKEKYPDKPPRIFTPANMPGSAPKVQQQPNLTDCGLYLCQNTETFFKNPIRDFTLPITTLKRSWFAESEVRGKRETVAALIRKLATEQNQVISLQQSSCSSVSLLNLPNTLLDFLRFPSCQ